MPGKAEGGEKDAAFRAFAHAPYAACAAGAPRGPREGSDARSGLRPAAVFLSLTYAQAPSSPRPVFTVWLLSQLGSGARCPCHSFSFLGASTAPRRCFRPGWVGRARPDGPALLPEEQAGGSVGPYRPDLHRGPDLWWAGSHQATLPFARPTRTPSPSPTPRSGAGFPRGRCRHYAGAARGRGQNDGKHC